MLFSAAVLAASVVSSVLAWGNAKFDVQVGPNGKLVFDPSNITANVNDTVTFHFNPKNHSVTQSSFQEPCTNLTGGFDSGFNPVAVGTGVNKGPTFNITVNDTKPIWVHCNQMANTSGSHCGAGMVFAVNPGAPGSAKSFQNFLDIALAIGASLQGAGNQTASAPIASGAGKGKVTKTASAPVTSETGKGKVTKTGGGKVTQTGSGKVTTETGTGKVTTETGTGKATTETGTGKASTETGTGTATSRTSTAQVTSQTGSERVTSQISTGQETSSVLSSVSSAESTASAGTTS